MDINQSLQSIIQNQVPVTQEWMPSVTGNQVLSNAVSSKKIFEAPVESLKDVLKFVMILVGIREQNIPNDGEKKVLIDFIQRLYGGHSLMEIKLAFEMSVTDKLTFEKGENSHHYENFSCGYFAKVMNAYRKWAASEIHHLPKKELKELPPTPVDWTSTWEDYKTRAVIQDVEKMIIILPVCDWLIDKDILKLTEQEQIDIFQSAKYNYWVELQDNLNVQNRELCSRLTSEKYMSDHDLVLNIHNRAKIMAVRNILRGLRQDPSKSI